MNQPDTQLFLSLSARIQDRHLLHGVVTHEQDQDGRQIFVQLRGLMVTPDLQLRILIALNGNDVLTLAVPPERIVELRDLIVLDPPTEDPDDVDYGNPDERHFGPDYQD